MVETRGGGVGVGDAGHSWFVAELATIFDHAVTSTEATNLWQVLAEANSRKARAMSPIVRSTPEAGTETELERDEPELRSRNSPQPSDVDSRAESTLRCSAMPRFAEEPT